MTDREHPFARTGPTTADAAAAIGGYYERKRKRTSGHVFVKTASGLVIPFKPPELEPVAAAEREAERKPAEYLLTSPRQAWRGYIVRAADGEPELWLEALDVEATDELIRAAIVE
jgi:hypothetical protein